MNDLQSLANIGEIVGAVAVVVSLVYLAVQVRQNTKAQQSENFSRALDRIAAMQATLSQDSETAVIFSNGVSDTATLSPRERLQFTWAMYELFGAFEFLYLSSRQNAIPEGDLATMVVGDCLVADVPGRAIMVAGQADSVRRELYDIRRQAFKEEPDGRGIGGAV